MSERDEHQHSHQREVEQHINEISFSYLAGHPTVQGWKRKLYSLFEGESNETLSRLGSIEQYVRVLLAESVDQAHAKYCFSEALSQIIKEWTPQVIEPAERLYNIFLTVAAFTPPGGFIKTLDYLNKHGDFRRGPEPVAGKSAAIDLYKRGLIALARYYPVPPQHSQDDLGFLAYKRLLEKNLRDESYGGYAAVRLLELGVLDIKSNRFSSLLLSSENIGTEVFRYLINLADEPEEKQSVEEKFGNILVICARAGEIEKFGVIASSLDMIFDPEGDLDSYIPTLKLADGTVFNISLDMEEVKDTALNYYVEYNKEKLHELLAPDIIDEGKIGRYVSGYLEQVISDDAAVRELVKELEHFGASLFVSGDHYAIRMRKQNHKKEIPLKLNDKTLTAYMIWEFKSREVASSSIGS